MSNLGMYQVMTSMAKKLGGPFNLIATCVGAGALIGAGTATGVNHIKKSFDEKKRVEEAAVIHKIIKEGRSNEGLLFQVGEEFKVLEVDGDAALIEKIGDSNSPYFVSLKFLVTISDFDNGFGGQKNG